MSQNLICMDFFTFPASLWLGIVAAKDLIKLQVKGALLSALPSNLSTPFRIVSKLQYILSTEDLQTISIVVLQIRGTCNNIDKKSLLV
jgi:hypothetical protein